MTAEHSSIHRYRPHIDGLRAIAVLSVVLYHLDVPGISGGFAGVDVFLVISGYLIIGQIVEDQRNGTFSFMTFWARRAIRILPPYFLVIVTSVVIAKFVLTLPDEINEFGAQVTNSALMIVNHYFLSKQGYFDTEAEFKPLLHLWSLAVEEQFYLVAPLVIFGVMAVATPNRKVIGLCFVAFTASLVGCIWFTGADEDRNYAFYLMPLRMWEFMAGGAAGLLLAPTLMRLPKRTLDLIGLAALAALIFVLITISDLKPYPSYFAIFPVLATATLIAIAECVPNTPAARVLSTKPLVAIGLISYAWYLWHWPLIAFLKIQNFGSLTSTMAIVVGGLSFALAVLTYLLLERPLKNWRKTSGSDRTWIPVSAGIVASLAIAFGGTTINETSGPVTALDQDYPKTACSLNTAKSQQPCVDLSKGQPIGLLIGDSHARPFWQQLDQRLQESKFQLATLIGTGCVGLFDIQKFNRAEQPLNRSCSKHFKNGLRLMKKGLHPEFAVIASRWNQFGHRTKAKSGGLLLGESGSKIPAQDQSQIFLDKLRATIAALQDAGVKRILIVAQIPEHRVSPLSCTVRAAKYGIPLDQYCTIPRGHYEDARRDTMELLERVVSTTEGVRIFDPIDMFCDSTLCRPFEPDGTLLYRDNTHINSKTGAAALLKFMEDDLNWLMPQREETAPR